MFEVNSQKLAQLQEVIIILTTKLEQAKLEVSEWTDASARLSQSAAEARARNQGLGRGVGGLILGSKFRTSMRSAAVRSNAAIAQDVVKKRAKIAEGKRQAQEHVRLIQSELSEAKKQYKSLVALGKTQSKSKNSAIKESVDSIDLLQKLKEAHDLGLLTEEEFELKRQKIVSGL
jgi:hypothetical protein